MKRNMVAALLLLAFALPAAACAHSTRERILDVRILSDAGGEFRQLKTYPRIKDEASYYYLEAVRGQRYSVQVTNRSSRRVGLVIAVDGRNIIDGAKSELKRTERMYILGPYETNSYEGWRTGMDRTNRFYFTEQSDSYAEKVFADGSAMGTIAIACYGERVPSPLLSPGPLMRKEQSAAGAPSPAAPMESNSYDRSDKKNDQAGTGFGETTYSPARTVSFVAEDRITQKIVMKYEWTAELCRKGIIPCEPANRLWPDTQFAPVPHDFRG